jgi:glycosyltransferase involved in cell wall biosynthesis
MTYKLILLAECYGIKKVVHIVLQSRYDGVTVYSTRLIKSLPDYKHLILSCYKGPAQNEIIEMNIPCYHLINKGSISNWSVPIKYLKSISFFRRNRFDVIHYHHAGIGVLLIAVLMKKRARVIHHLHGGNLIGDNVKQHISFIHRLILIYLSKYTEQVAVADHVFNEYIQKIKRISNATIIKNSVPFKFIYKKDKTSYIGYIGRSEPTKGYSNFKYFSLKIKSDFKWIRFLIMGDNLENEDAHIEQIASSFQINQFYENIDLLLYTSIAPESLPLVILEAISFDVGVIARPLKGVVEILGKDYPLYFQNEEELLSKVEYFYSQNSCRDSLSALHRERLKEFNFLEMIRKIDLLYKFEKP